MKLHRYSRWDGSQEDFSLDARKALDALSDLMMEGLDVEEALEWMRQAGFELGGMQMRVMGVQELLDDLREQMDSLYQQYHMEQADGSLRAVVNPNLQVGLLGEGGRRRDRLQNLVDGGAFVHGSDGLAVINTIMGMAS